MQRIVEQDFSEVQKVEERPVVRKIGQIGEVQVYFDQYIEPNEVLIGFKERKLNFLIGSTEDMQVYEKALKLYNEHQNVVDREELNQRGY
jgi:hypothetical protein